MAAPLFRPKPDPLSLANKSLHKSSRPRQAHVVVSGDHEVWNLLATVSAEGRALVALEGVSFTGAKVFLLPKESVSPAIIRAVIDWYEKKGASVQLGAPTRFERPELV